MPDEAVPTSDPEPTPDPVPPAEAADQARVGSPERASAHDPTGLELARSVAAALRGSVLGRGRSSGARHGRRRTTELSGAHPDGRDPAPIGASVDKFVRESGWATDLAVHGVFGRWESIVGAEVAAHCVPESYQDGRLKVRTDSTAWATQLGLLAPTVVRRMNEELGDGTVLVIDVLGPVAPSWKKGRRSVRDGRGPRDTYG